MRRWIQREHLACQLAVSLLILALLPTPWPKVEFHNVRHHDAVGQVCEYHDHLLRWHPDASGADDVAVLHWHWAWPTPGVIDSDHDSAGPRLHAHLSADSLPTADPAPAIVADATGRLLAPPVAEPTSTTLEVHAAPRDLLAFRSGDPRALTFGATFAPRTSLTSRLHRWSC